MGPDLPASTVDALLNTVLTHSRLQLTFALRPTPPHPPVNTPALTVVFDGPDVPFLLARNAELLLALEHVAAKALRLAPEQHDRLSFDAANFKASRDRAIERRAAQAVAQVRASGLEFHFPPMNSRERRLLHLALTPSGLLTQSEGEGPTRHLVLHPKAAPGS